MPLNIIKIGGNVIDNPEALQSFLEDFAQMPSPKILVHGGGKIASELSQQTGITPRFVDGRRITDLATLDIAVMVYGGLLNKKITASLQALGCNAIGLSGADANTVRSEKRPPNPIDFGYVGDVKQTNPLVTQALLQLQLTPVFCALTHDGKGQLLNTNADTMAAEIAIGLSDIFETNIYYCFEKQGVLTDVDDANSVVRHIDTQRYATLLSSGKISGGMLPKLENCFQALNRGVASVHIGGTSMIRHDNSLPHTTITL